MTNTIRLVFGPDRTPSGAGESRLVFWDRRTVGPGADSLPERVERDAASLRQGHLLWAHQLAGRRIDGRSVAERLSLDGHFSYWWMTLLAEKSPLKTPELLDALKLRALEAIAAEIGADRIELDGADRRLARVLERWCRSRGTEFRVLSADPRPRRRTARSALPQTLLGALFLVRWLLLRRLPLALRPAAPKRPGSGPSPLVVVYMPHYDIEAGQRGEFRSVYLGAFHDELARMDKTVDWVWIYGADDHARYRECLDFRDRLNGPRGRDRFHLLDGFVGFMGLVRILRDWFSLTRRARALRTLRDDPTFELLRDGWERSLHGPTLVENLLMREGLRAMAARLPLDDWGLYVWENEAWEAALVSQWRKRSKKRLVGYQHSTLTALDLRSFCHEHEFTDAPPLARPFPDFVAANGKATADLLIGAGIPAGRVRVVEAFRYAYLKGRRSARAGKTKDRDRALLVLTGIQEDDARFQADLLSRALAGPGLPRIARVLIKPHPFMPAGRFLHGPAAASAEIWGGTLETALNAADAVFSCYSTTAGLEAAWLGLPLVLCAPDGFMNTSPLLGLPGARFVATPEALRAALDAPGAVKVPEDAFCLDDGAGRLAELLGGI